MVSICAPNLLHREIGVAAAEAGKHFWIEKPVGRDAEEAGEVAAAAARPGVVTSIGYNYRHAPAVEHARELVAERPARPHHQCPRRLLLRLCRRAQGGVVVAVQAGPGRHGALGDLLSHVVDLVSYIVGPIAEVNALTSTVYTEAADPADGLGHPLRGHRGR